MDNFWTACIKFLISRYTVAGLVAIASTLTNLFVQRILANRNKYAFARTIFTGIFNGMLVFTLMSWRGSIYTSLYMVLITILVNSELFFLGRDSWMARFYIFAVTTCDYSCLYVSSLALMNFLFHRYLTVPLNIYYTLAFSISMILTIVFATVLLKNGNKFVVMFKALNQSWGQGSLVFTYSLAVCVIMLFSAFMMLPAMLTVHDSTYLTVIHSFYEMIVAIILLIVSFAVLVMQFQLQQNLGHERTLRSNIQKNTLISYSFNATKDKLDKKIKFFRSDLWEGDTSYFKMIQNFIKRCIHPDDQSEFLYMSSQSYPWDALAAFDGNSIVSSFRISPTEILKVVNLPYYVKDAIAAEQKEWRWSEMTCVVTKEAITGDVMVDISFVDIDDKVSHEYELREAATVDTLTGMLNRGTAEKTIKNYLSSDKVEGAMFIIDLDHFKEVNDILGHGKGDELLKEMATMVSSMFRGSDIVGRLGGDEFIVFCKDTNDKEFLTRKAKLLNEKGYKIHPTETGDNINTSMSIGVALCPQDGTDFETLYSHADVALYKSKTTGRNKYFFYAHGQEMKLFDFEVDGLKLGIDEIDEQHKKLVDLTNEFMQMVLSENDVDWKDHVLNTLNGMLTYSQEHFSFEEKIMEEIGYAKFEEHKKTHDEFVMYAVARFAGFESMNKDDSVELMNFLKNWLVTHILKADKQYVDDFSEYFAKNKN